MSEIRIKFIVEGIRADGEVFQLAKMFQEFEINHLSAMYMLPDIINSMKKKVREEMKKGISKESTP